jgi:hypothetical protein
MDQADRVMKRNTSRTMKHNLILQGAMSPIHRRKSSIDDQEDLPLSIVPIPDILPATQSMHCSSFLVPILLNLRMRFLLRERVVTPRVTKTLIHLIRTLNRDQSSG